MKLLDVRYDNVQMTDGLQIALCLAERTEPSSIFFLNLDCLNKSSCDEEYRRILNSADLVLPDGVGVKLVTRLFGGRMRENCNGTDFSPLFMRALASSGRKIFFLGGQDGIAEKAAEAVSLSIPGSRIVGTHSGYFKDDASVIKQINASGADILFVAMGVPYQEKWIARNRAALKPRVCLGVGALFDWLSGRFPRAPHWMRDLNLEWCWRLGIEPRRLFKRYCVDGFGFLITVILRSVATKNPSVDPSPSLRSGSG